MNTFDPTPRFYTFWSINDRLDQRRLRSQLDDMKTMGFDGAVFHPRFYPADPPYMSAPYLKDISDLILYAKSIGMEFWIYDENGWPSGTAGGLMLERHPENASVWVELSEQKTAETIHSFQQAAAINSKGKSWHLNTHRCRALDCLDPEACRRFLDITHEGYRKGLSPEAFDYVSAIFSDEPELGLSWDKIPPHGNIPWTKQMPSLWKERYSDDLLAQLPLMFFPGEGYRAFRIRYWEFCTDLLAAGFFDPYLAWCKRHGKTFTAHVKGEEHPMFQVTMSGSCHQIFQHIALPGIDALERFPSNNFFPRQVASVAQQFGDGRSMVECFGGAGWGARPEDLERYLNWLGSHGLTHYILHLYQYRLISNAIRDWPPSEPNHLTWREVFPVVLKRFKDRFKEPKAADILVVAPYRGIMAEYEPSELARTNIHIASPHPDSPAARLNDGFMNQIEKLYSAGFAYHVCDERTFEESGRVDGDRLALGNCRYSQVLLADGTIFNTSGQQLFSALRTARVSCSQLIVTPVDAPAALADKPPVAPCAAGLSVPIELQWHATPPTLNELLLETSATADGGFSATFQSELRTAVEFVFADDLVAATLNGHELKLHPAEDGTIAAVPVQYLASNNQLMFRGKTTFDRPFVWLRGPILILSRSAYTPGPNDTIKTEGPFDVAPAKSPDAANLIESGLPFCSVPVICDADFTLDLAIAAGRLQLVGILADAAKLSLDGKDLGFAYGPDWTVVLPAALSPGRHRLTLSLIPSTYNHYGPHHYVDGDHRIISPHQYDGRKSFADRADAPENTHVSAWHFKPLRAPQRILILLP